MANEMMMENMSEVVGVELKFKDLVFEKKSYYEPEHVKADKDGQVSYWVAINPNGNAVAVGDTKKECISAAREYVREQKSMVTGEAMELESEERQTEETVEASAETETCEEVCEEQQEDIEQTEESCKQEEIPENDIDAWLIGYLPKKRQAAVVMLKKDDDGYWCRIGNGFVIRTGDGAEEDVIHEAKWKEFLKAFKNVVSAA